MSPSTDTFITQTAGTLTGHSFHLAPAAGKTLTWNLEGGAIDVANIQFGSSVIINATGGTIRTTNSVTFLTGADVTVNLANDATFNIGANIPGFSLSYSENMLNFADGWTGSITLPWFAMVDAPGGDTIPIWTWLDNATEGEWNYIGSLLTYDGQPLTKPVFDAKFVVENDGLTLRGIPEPASALLGGLGLLALLRRRRG